jgi:calcium-dependent protein kinase
MFDKEAMLQEMEILKGASHPNVLQVFELFEDETQFYIVTEYFEGQSLLNRANDQMIFQEHDINHIMKEIL